MANMNKVITGLVNMITKQVVFADNITGGAVLADRYRKEGSMYGDTMRYYAADIIASNKWELEDNKGNGGLDYTILSTKLPKDPKVQDVVLDQFRQIWQTLDNKLLKQAFFTEGVFGQFISVTRDLLYKAKMKFENAIVNSYIGTAKGETAAQNITIPLLSTGTSALEKEAENRLNGLTIGTTFADLKVELADFTRDFNDYKHVQSYKWEDFDLIWNKKYINQIRTMDLPTIFHKDGIIPEGSHVLNSRWFGDVIEEATQTNIVGARALYDIEYTVAGVKKVTEGGDEIEKGTYTDDELSALNGLIYKENDKIIGKLIHKEGLVYMSGFNAATEFFNPSTLRTNSYVTWGFSKPQRLFNYPTITLSVQ